MDSLVYIGQAKALFRLLTGTLYLPPQLLQFFPVHARAVVPHRQTDYAAVLLPMNMNIASGPLVLYAMVQSVLHQGLQCQLGNLEVIHRLVQLDIILQDVPIAHPLNLQVSADMLLLLPDGDKFLSFAEYQPEKAGESDHHVHCLIRLISLDQPDYGIQRIVQEMGIDLFLQKPQVHPAHLLFVLPDLMDQHLDILRHIVETLAQSGNLILGMYPGPDRKVPLSHLFRGLV